MIRDFEPIDDKTQIGQYPGYIGLIWDGNFYPGPELELLASFELQEYLEHFWSGETRQLILRKLPGVIECEANEYCNWPELLSQLPSITVSRDEGPPDGGPASGSGYVFFISEGTTSERLIEEVTSLRLALEWDLKKLRKRRPQQAVIANRIFPPGWG